jgi:hypothetical protein
MRISRCNHCESVYLTKYLKMLIKVLHRFMHQTTDFFLSVKPLYILMCTCYCKSQCCCCTLNTVFTYVFSLLVAVCDFAMRMLPDYPRQESHPFPGYTLLNNYCNRCRMLDWGYILICCRHYRQLAQWMTQVHQSLSELQIHLHRFQVCPVVISVHLKRCIQCKLYP